MPSDLYILYLLLPYEISSDTSILFSDDSISYTPVFTDIEISIAVPSFSTVSCALITAVPAAFAFTVPSADTSAASVLSDLNPERTAYSVISLLSASVKERKINCDSLPTSIVDEPSIS